MVTDHPAASPPPPPVPAGAGPPASVLSPDPELYDSPRAVRARAKGLDAPYIAGGDDPDIGPALAEERHYGRLLVAMVIAIMAAGFVIGIAIALIAPPPMR